MVTYILIKNKCEEALLSCLKAWIDVESQLNQP